MNTLTKKLAPLAAAPFLVGVTVISTSATAASLGSIGIQSAAGMVSGNQPILVASKLTTFKANKRVAKTLRGNLTISPSPAQQADGYPTPGRAIEACGGVGNVFSMYDIGPDGQESNHSFHCVD